MLISLLTLSTHLTFLHIIIQSSKERSPGGMGLCCAAVALWMKMAGECKTIHSMFI